MNIDTYLQEDKCERKSDGERQRQRQILLDVNAMCEEGMQEEIRICNLIILTCWYETWISSHWAFCSQNEA